MQLWDLRSAAATQTPAHFNDRWCEGFVCFLVPDNRKVDIACFGIVRYVITLVSLLEKNRLGFSSLLCTWVTDWSERWRIRFLLVRDCCRH